MPSCNSVNYSTIYYVFLRSLLSLTINSLTTGIFTQSSIASLFPCRARYWSLLSPQLVQIPSLWVLASGSVGWSLPLMHTCRWRRQKNLSRKSCGRCVSCPWTDRLVLWLSDQVKSSICLVWTFAVCREIGSSCLCFFCVRGTFCDALAMVEVCEMVSSRMSRSRSLSTVSNKELLPTASLT